MTKKAVLLINLGTPDDYKAPAVRRYLKEFLNDPRVIDLRAWARWALVNLIILPFRSKKSSKAYQKIWRAEGSPLLVNSVRLKEALANELGTEYVVEMAMRYGHPSIPDVMNKFKNCSSLTVIPLFPQYSSAATGSAIEKLLNSLSSQWNIPHVNIRKEFYNHSAFIKAYAEVIQKQLKDKQVETVIFSYHGLPERHIQKSNCKAACDHLNACAKIDSDNQYCYRAQCYATTHLIAKELGLADNQYIVSFQSRLGRTPWIKPYTDILLPDLIAKGIKDIAVVSPSFVADCLETLEEIDIRTREQWNNLGGRNFIFIPCLNDSPQWVGALTQMVTSKN